MFFTRAAVARALPFTVYITFLSLNDYITKSLMPVMQDTRWLYALRVSIVALLLVWFWRQYTELNQSVSLRHFSRLSTQSYFICVIAGLFVFALWIFPYPVWATMSHGDGFDPSRTDGGGIDIGLALIRLSGAALVVPLMEELFWRSFFMRWLQSKNFLKVNPSRVGVFSFIATAVLFALEHTLWLAGLFAGLVYGWLYMRERNLWAPVISHAVTNGVLGIWVIFNGNWRYW